MGVAGSSGVGLHRCGSMKIAHGRPRIYCGKTVTKPLPLSRLGLPLSEKQIPQVVENLESGGKPKEALERVAMRPRQVRCPGEYIAEADCEISVAEVRAILIAAMVEVGGRPCLDLRFPADQCVTSAKRTNVDYPSRPGQRGTQAVDEYNEALARPDSVKHLAKTQCLR